VENFNLYNIKLDSPNLVVIGGNAVGGIAGIIRGEVDIDGLSSNVSVTSTRVVTGQNYSIYNSIANGKHKSENLEFVYYAGSVAGIIDAYTTSSPANAERYVNVYTYSMVRNISVDGNITLVGDTVGVAFGFIGENTYVMNITTKTSGELAGAQYSGGVVGENRGVIENATFVTGNEEVFARSSNVLAGIVGLNLGGLVINSSTDAIIISNSTTSVVGGIIGRNINGVVANSTFDGIALGKYVGGIVGSDYSGELLKSKTSGLSAIESNSNDAIPSGSVSYYLDAEMENKINNYSNVKIGKNALDDLTSKLHMFYAHSLKETEIETSAQSRVLGLLVGLTDNVERFKDILGYMEIVNDDGDGILEEDYGETSNWIGGAFYSFENNALVFNNGKENQKQGVVVNSGNITCTISSAYKVDNSTYNVITYILGAEVTFVDGWMQDGYLDNYMLIWVKAAQGN